MRTNFTLENQNLRMIRGDTLSFNVECINHMNENIEFDNVFFTCKKNPDDEAIVAKELGNGITFEDGIYVVRVSPEDTAEVEIGKYYYDIKAEIDDDAYTIVSGTLTIEQNIT